jgi:hypothetical protein
VTSIEGEDTNGTTAGSSFSKSAYMVDTAIQYRLPSGRVYLAVSRTLTLLAS